MNAALAFIGTYLLSLFVALLAALQLGDYYGANREFILIILALLVFVSLVMLVFIVASATARRPAAFHWVAAFLALLALAPLALPAIVQKIADRSINPHSVGIENTYITIELIVPALIAVAVQWGLVRRRWLRLRGEDGLSRWPWVATLLAGLIILNPLGLEILGQAISHHASNWMRDATRAIAFGGIGVLIAIAFIEYYIRGRLLRRRLAPFQPARAAG